MTVFVPPHRALSKAVMTQTDQAWLSADRSSIILPTGADERLPVLAQCWLSMHPSTGELPGLQHFEVLRVVELLPWIWLFEVHRPPLRFRFRHLNRELAFRYRLLGRAHVAAMGCDNTGLWVDEVRPKLRSEPAYDRFTAAVEQRAIGYYKGPPTYPVEPGFIGIERLVLPLASDGRTVDMLLGITVYSQ